MRISAGRNQPFRGKVNPVLLAVVPPLLFVSWLMVSFAFRLVAPAPFTLDHDSGGTVEAIEVLHKIKTTTKKGLLIPQSASLRAAGNSRVVVTHPHPEGDFLLVAGRVSASFLQAQKSLDRMLHLELGRNQLRVESGGETIPVLLLLPRHESNPLYVDVPSVEMGVNPMALLFPDATIGPQPGGVLYSDHFLSDQGMSITATIGIGPSGTMGLGDAAQFNLVLDDESHGWVEAPQTVRIQHTAVGTQDLDIGLLIERDPNGSAPYQIFLFGQPVATVSRR
jgi:hypothetical protein